AFAFAIRAHGNQNMVFQLEGTNSSGFTPNGTDIHIAWYMNTTGSTQSYKGPDGNTYTLNDLSSSVWINHQLVHNNVARYANFNHRSLADFRIRLATAIPTTVTFDNLEVWNVPAL